MSVKLFDYQIEAVKKMKNGVSFVAEFRPSGKSLTALSYYLSPKRRSPTAYRW